jgi:hypothetical protein
MGARLSGKCAVALGASGRVVLLDADETLLEMDNRERAACLLAHRHDENVAGVEQVALQGMITAESAGVRFHASSGRAFRAPGSSLLEHFLIGAVTRIRGRAELRRLGQALPDLERILRDRRRREER